MELIAVATFNILYVAYDKDFSHNNKIGSHFINCYIYLTVDTKEK